MLSLSEKIKLLDYKKSNTTIGCRDITEIFNVGKTSAATIIKNEEKLRKDYASSEGNRKRIREGKFNKLNEAMYLWYTKGNFWCSHTRRSIVDERENDRN